MRLHFLIKSQSYSMNSIIHIHTTYSMRCIKTQSLLETRMHSSRMRTSCSLTVCCSLLPGGGLLRGVCLVWGGAWSGVCLLWGGVSAPGGCLVGGCLLPVGIPACTEADTPPVDRHTLVKILPMAQLRCGR